MVTLSNNFYPTITAGGYHSVALLEDGQLVCWGANHNDQCNPPAELCSRVVQIAAGGYHSIALLEDGQLVCWGSNNNGQCDPPEQGPFLVPSTGRLVKSAGKR